MSTSLPIGIMRRYPAANAAVLALALLLIWGTYRVTVHLPAWVDAFVAKPVLWLGPTLLLVLVVERRPLTSLGLSDAHVLSHAALGAAVGAALAARLALPILRGDGDLASTSVVGVVLVRGATAVVEEVTYRGYVMRRLWDWGGNVVLANLLSTLAFAAVHVPLLVVVEGQSATEALRSLATISALGLVFGWLFAQTRTLAAPIAAHTIWDGAITLLGEG